MDKLIGLPEFCNTNPTIKHGDNLFPHTKAIPCNHTVLLKENFLSEFLTKEEKRKVLKNLGINSTIEWGEIGGYIENQPDLIKRLKQFILKETEGKTATTQITYTNEAYPNITTLQEALDTILYKDLTLSVQITPSVVELGDTVDSATLTWNYNKSNIKEQQVDDTVVDNNIREFTIQGPINATTVKTITGTDGTTTVSKTGVLNFYPGIYYGVGITQPSTDTLNKKLQGSRNCSIFVNASDSQYIWILLPTTYGTPTFTVGGFSGGFQIVGQITQKITEYTVWRSDNHSLGATTINIS